MIIKTIEEEDLSNYKKPSMLIGFPKCTFKCDRECGLKVCQNSILAKSKDIEISNQEIIDMYMSNKFTNAFVFGGLEPFDTFVEMINIVIDIRKQTKDDIVIYTGYYKEEILDKLKELQEHDNIIVKFGRFIPNQNSHYDDILGVRLASEKQYAERIN